MHLFAYGSVPHASGTFTLYKELRNRLIHYGWDIRCVTVGANEHALCDPAFIDDGCVSLVPREKNVKTMAQAFSSWCDQYNVRVVMPLNSVALLSAVPHLSQGICYVPRCTDSVEVGYQRTVYAKERASRFIVTTPRQQRDLNLLYNIPRQLMSLISHGIDLENFSHPTRVTTAMSNHPLQIAFLGNLDINKGTLLLPAILQKLQVPYHLRIAGDGPYRSQLEKLVSGIGAEEKVDFLGRIPRSRVPQLLNESNILLFPSKNEGFGFSLIEAMASGCVPISSHIEGVTDFIIDDGVTGLLCPIGDTNAFAEAITTLYNDREQLEKMSQRARQTVQERFNIENVCRKYAEVLEEVLTEGISSWMPRNWNDFRVPLPYRKKWKNYIPPKSRRAIRNIMHKLRNLAI